MAALIGGLFLLRSGATIFGVTFRRRDREARRTAGGARQTQATATANGSDSVQRSADWPRESYYAPAPPSRAKGRPPGWYSVEGDMAEERFWDGTAWVRRRTVARGAGVSVPFRG